MRTLKTVATAALLSMALAGCNHLPKIPRITTFKPIAIPNVQPTPLSLKPIQWEVYTLAELSAFVAQQEASGTNPNTVYYVLPKDGYDGLAYNLAELRRFIEDQKSTNLYLVESIEINNGTRDEHDTPAPSPE